MLVFLEDLFFSLFYFWLQWVFAAARRLALAAVRGAPLPCDVTTSHVVASLLVEHGLSGRGSRASESWLSGRGSRASESWLSGRGSRASESWLSSRSSWASESWLSSYGTWT